MARRLRFLFRAGPAAVLAIFALALPWPGARPAASGQAGECPAAASQDRHAEPDPAAQAGPAPQAPADDVTAECDPEDEAAPCPAEPGSRRSDEDADLDILGIDGPEPLPNFHEVSPGILRSGQPNREGLARLAAAGVRTVLSLRLWVAAGERAEARRLGMRMASVPMDGIRLPSFRQTDLAVKVLADARRRPVLVHCRYGKDRTGAVVAAYRVAAEGWSPAAAAAEARRIGCCVPTFGNLDAWLAAYREHRLGRRARRSPDARAAEGRGACASRARLNPGAGALESALRAGPAAIFDRR